MKTYRVLWAALLLAVLAMPSAASAQGDAWPTKPVRIIVPFAPGGSLDIMARLTSPWLGELLGQQFIVDNRQGASGNIGTELVAHGPADGYNLLSVTLPFVVNPQLVAKAPYNPTADFAGVGLVGTSPSLITVHPSVPVHTTRELLAFARARPGQVNYVGSGIGSNPHVAGELFNYLGKTSMVVVQFKGGGVGLIAAMSGEVSVTFTNIAETSTYVKAGKLRPIAVTSAKRSTIFPEVPTVAESGLPGYEFTTWFGFVAPARTPPRVIATLSDALVKSLAPPARRKLFIDRGVEVVAGTPDEFTAHIKKESERWARVVRERGMRAE